MHSSPPPNNIDMPTTSKEPKDPQHTSNHSEHASIASLPVIASEWSNDNINKAVSVADHEGSRNLSQQLTPHPPEISEIASFPQQNTSSVFHRARDTNIGGNAHFLSVGKQKNVHVHQYVMRPLNMNLDALQPFVSFDAFHDSSAQDPQRQCHPGTREKVLKQMRNWIDNPSRDAPRILWMHGPAGVGKSAIAQTISNSYGRGGIAATFFFFRSDPNRNDGNRLFPTIAWQLAKSIPGAKSRLAEALNDDMDIPRKAVEVQFEQLISLPLLPVADSGNHALEPTQVVVIDGIDECSNEKLQKRALDIIGKSVVNNRTQLRFLISSRSELHIKEILTKFESVTLRVDLATLDDTHHDIEKYLRSEFSRIASKQDIATATWPPEHVIRNLVFKSSGHFVYASTVIGFVNDEYSTAASQLDIILGLQPIEDDNSPFSELDTLYREILQRQRKQRSLKDFFNLFVSDCSQADYALLLNVTKDGLHRKLHGIHSIFRFEPQIDLYHRSFLDFLKDESRSRQYHTDRRAATRRYLELIVETLVQHASRAIKQPNYHGTEHFAPQFAPMIKRYPLPSWLLLQDLETILNPLVRIKEESLKLYNPSSPWKRGPCDDCHFLSIIDDLLLHLAFLRGVSCVVAPYCQFVSECTRDIPSIVVEASRDLNTCLYLLLPLLRNRKEWEDGILINILYMLLRFESFQVASEIQTLSDAQNLIDAICHIYRPGNEAANHQFAAQDVRGIINLVLDVYARMPLVPNLFLDDTAIQLEDERRFTAKYKGERVMVWKCNGFGINPLCQRACIWRILSHNNISPLLGIFEYSGHFSFVFPRTENGTLREWRREKKPSISEMQRCILEVAKAIQYMHSLGLVLNHPIRGDLIVLDFNLRAQLPGFCLPLRYCSEAPLDYRDLGNCADGMCTYESGVFNFGCLFYEIYFGIFLSDRACRGRASTSIVANRPKEPEIDEIGWELIQRCCSVDPNKRPTMDQVVKEIESWISV